LKRWRHRQPSGNKTQIARQRPTKPELLKIDWRTKDGRRVEALAERYAEQYCLFDPSESQWDKLLEAAFAAVRMEDIAARALQGEVIDDALWALLSNVKRRTLNSLQR
jgi:hypothetical protein